MFVFLLVIAWKRLINGKTGSRSTTVNVIERTLNFVWCLCFPKQCCNQMISLNWQKNDDSIKIRSVSCWFMEFNEIFIILICHRVPRISIWVYCPSGSTHSGIVKIIKHSGVSDDSRMQREFFISMLSSRHFKHRYVLRWTNGLVFSVWSVECGVWM